MAVYLYHRAGTSELQRLVVAISTGGNLTYGHEAALVFEETSYFSGPMEWTTTKTGGTALRRLSGKERGALTNRDAAFAEGFLFAIERDEGEAVLVAARDVTLDRTHVFYYAREDLEPGQQLAFWLT